MEKESKIEIIQRINGRVNFHANHQVFKMMQAYADQECQDLTTANEQLKAECDRYKEALEKINVATKDCISDRLMMVNNIATAALTKDN
jgi:hypothetical protein